MKKCKNKIPGFKWCKKCDTLRPEDIFYFRPNTYDVLVPTGYCKSCMGVKNIKPTVRSYNKCGKYKKNTEREDMEPTIKEYIRRVILRNYAINIVDIYRIIHYYQILFNSFNEPYETIDKELKRKWDNLESWYNGI
jgi:hypothetical protein